MFNRFYQNVKYFSKERLVSVLCNPEGELNSNVEEVISVFESTDYPKTIDMHITDTDSVMCSIRHERETPLTITPGCY